MKQRSSILFITILLLASVACSQKKTVVTDTRYIVSKGPGEVPPGVVRYCWEEPIVEMAAVGPGLNSDNTWYQASHIAMKEVRQGRWRPCRPMKSEIKGDNE